MSFSSQARGRDNESRRPTDRQKRALEFATRYFRRDAAYFSSTEGNWLKSKEILAKQSPDEQEKQIRALGKLAMIDGDIRVIDMLCDLAARHLAENKQMPESLRIFTCLFLQYPFTKWKPTGKGLVPGEKIKSKPGPHRRERSNRNHAICVAIKAIMYEWGFDATRNPASKDRRSAPLRSLSSAMGSQKEQTLI